MRNAWLRSGLLRRRVPDLAAGATYALLAFLYLGARLLRNGGDRYVGNGHDPQIFVWAFAWWPHAILHGQNPFVSHAIWAPDGLNLTWTTTVPGLALLFAPLTWIVGPIASYNIAAVLMPAFSAWTAFVLCRYLTKAFWPALVGGYLFGFSSYLLATEGGGHLHLAAVFLFPLAALAILRYLDRDLTGRGLVVRLGPLLAFQLLISTEVAFSLILAIACGVVLALVLVPERRPRLWSLVLRLVSAGSLAFVLTSPFVYYLVAGLVRGSYNDPDKYVADLANFAVPTNITWLAGHGSMSISNSFPANFSEQGAYLGLPTLAILIVFLGTRLRAPTGRFLVAALAVAVVAALGAHAVVAGHRTVWLPWALLHHEPVFDNVLTARFSVFVALIAAVAVALWAASVTYRPARWLAPAIAAIALVPNLNAGIWASRYTVPPFFTDAAYRTCLDAGENVLPLPITGGFSNLWQAEAGFRFNLIGGDLGPSVPSSITGESDIQYIMAGNSLGADQAARLKSVIEAREATSVVVSDADAATYSGALDALATPQRVGGVLLYRFTSTPAACDARPGP